MWLSKKMMTMFRFSELPFFLNYNYDFNVVVYHFREPGIFICMVIFYMRFISDDYVWDWVLYCRAVCHLGLDMFYIRWHCLPGWIYGINEWMNEWMNTPIITVEMKYILLLLEEDEMGLWHAWRNWYCIQYPSAYLKLNHLGYLAAGDGELRSKFNKYVVKVWTRSHI
jgi:hypothetical protein